MTGTTNTLNGEAFMTFDGTTLALRKSAAGTPNLTLYDSGGSNPFLRFETLIGSHSIAVGVDENDSNKFKISYGSSAVFGTNDRIILDNSGNVGIGTFSSATFPSKTLDIFGDYKFSSSPNDDLDSSGVGYGDIVRIGSTGTTAGKIYYLNSSGGWSLTDADAVSTSSGMLAIAMSTDSGINGMLIRGFYRSSSFPIGNIGDILYLSTTSGELTTSAPAATGDVVRVVGYIVGTTGNTKIYFNPSNDWLEL
jgi:hypothetical protein